ncbi:MULTISPECIES: ABC transporter ATP-binding protein [Microbacterium]|uniref:ABC transporter ATP-binding protein n=1 Tax=Microbacterium galbinum TaxID=2851646 RepID=A0ABY4ISH3_9MICO|nr:ABC transporter ATP-binding protein [Microbacterium galbinum]UPL15205.1 ABC transporter ATP-binding protein [Microbacterium galbinum]
MSRIEVLTQSTPSIVVDHVSKRFLKRNSHSFKEAFVGWIRGRRVRADTFTALRDLTFQVGEGESVAVLGFNGSGKSTSLKLVSGVLEPDEGTVLTRGRVAGLIEVGAGFHPDLTGRENVFLNAAILGMGRKETEARFDAIVEFSEIGDFIDQEVKHYSSGMFMRLAFSVAIHVDLDILLVDEVLSVGDAPFREKCRARIKELAETGVTMLVVSHDMKMVEELCERGIVINRGTKIFDGPIADAIKVLKESTR